jgi:predicted TIM-barrel fold metal-dependent hydrolase
VDPKLRVILPPDPNPHPLKFTPPPGTCDTHFHVFGPPHLFPYVEARRYTPPAAPIEHFFGMAKMVGIERGIMVQPTVHRWDKASTFHAIEKGEGRLLGMVHANPDATEQDHRELHAGGVRGIRFNCVIRNGGSFNQERFQRTVSRVEALGWAVDLHIEADFLEPHAEMIRRIPLPVVMDHFANVHSEDSKEYKVLYDLLGEKHVWLKISGADRLLSRGADYDKVVSMARALIARAPDRMIWGTDWPHSNVFQHGQMPNDGDLMNIVLDFAPDEAIRKKVLSDNPARLFGFPQAEPRPAGAAAGKESTVMDARF